MSHLVLDYKELNFQWIDVVSPTKSELIALAKKYNLHATSVRDCLEPYHLPKVEKLENYLFAIIRVFDDESPLGADSMHEVTRKIAVFASDRFLVTVHRTETNFLKKFKKKWLEKVKELSTDYRSYLVTDLFNETYQSFDHAMDGLYQTLEGFEHSAIKNEWSGPLNLKEVYPLKRRAASIKRVLRISLDAWIGFKYLEVDSASPYYKDTKDNLQNNYMYAEELNENIQQFLNLSLSVQGQRTNEAMRVLTVFSAFFLPLTLFVGIYGMNFKWMPELEWKWGYPVSLLVMVLISVGIAIWFKRKRWL